MDHVATLRSFSKTKDFFIGIDSDGCVFDSMEPKHKFCFAISVLQSFGLAALARPLRDAWDFVNLNGKTRGCNRWLALRDTFQYLRDLTPYPRFDAPLAAHLDVIEKFIVAADTNPAIRLSNAGLRVFAAETLTENPAALTQLDEIVANAITVANSPQGRSIVRAENTFANCLLRMAMWSYLVDAWVPLRVFDVPPFPHVRESLDLIAPRADIMVVSATPNEALEREWKENGIEHYVGLIAGQELGKKAEHLKHGAIENGYDPKKILMMGDAPGDRKAAQSNGVLFYPINPGHEAASWKRFHDEAAQRFFEGTFAGEYEQALHAEFEAYLPAKPPWEVR